MPKNVFAGVGMAKGDKKDSAKIGAEAVRIAVENMKKQGGKMPGSFGLLFSSVKYDLTKLVASAHKEFGETPWIGCTSMDGEISSKGLSEKSCVAMIISSDYIHVGVGVGKNFKKKPREAGRIAASEAFKKITMDKYVDPYLQFLKTKKYKAEDLVKMQNFTMIVLGKGMEKGRVPFIPKTYDNDAALLGVVDEVGSQIPVVGGAAGDDWGLKRNYVFANGKVYEDSLVVAAVLSHLFTSTSLEHGYEPSGKIFLVNKSDGTKVQELNHKPAIEEYSRIVGISKDKLTKDMIGFSIKNPFGINDQFGNFWVRTSGGTFMNNLIFGTMIKQNTVLHLMKGEKQSILEACKDSLIKSSKKLGGKKPALAIIFSCVLRKRLLGEEIKKELKYVKENFGDVPVVGFYTFGEFGGMSGGQIGYHNQTVTNMIITDNLMSGGGKK